MILANNSSCFLGVCVSWYLYLWIPLITLVLRKAKRIPMKRKNNPMQIPSIFMNKSIAYLFPDLSRLFLVLDLVIDSFLENRRIFHIFLELPQ